MITVVLVVLAAVALAGFTYFVLERQDRRAWPAAAARGVAWAALGVLVLDVGCPAPPTQRRPVVLLDGSLSLVAEGGRWAEARALAAQLGDVRLFGDERASGPGDTLATRGRSLLAPALTAASAGERPVIVVTDGEIEDAADIPPDLLARTGVRVLPRERRTDVAITAVHGPARVTAGDSVALEIAIQATGEDAPDSIGIEVGRGPTRLARPTVGLRGSGAGRARVAFPSAALGAGDHVLRIALDGMEDGEPRTDVRLHLVSVAPTPGVVVLAAPGDWDARFLFQTIRDVAQLPVRGYVRIAPDRWRSMADLAPAAPEEVRQAARRADLLVLKGDPGAVAQGSRARGIWSWPSGEGEEPAVAGNWYLSAPDASPLSGAFLGAPIDSFPPATHLVPVRPGPSDWIALSAQEGRRGALRPAVVGRDDGRVRRVTTAVDGMWRWAFRGGSSEQTYRAWVAATTSWLLGGADSAQGVARPVRAVVQNGRPVVFEWAGRGAPQATPISWSGPGGNGSDTLRFDGGGRASLWLAPGEYTYRLTPTGGGTVAVEAYSDEWIPRPVTLRDQEARAVTAGARRAARDWLWLFGLCVLGLAGEWFVRRRLGLR